MKLTDLLIKPKQTTAQVLRYSVHFVFLLWGPISFNMLIIYATMQY